MVMAGGVARSGGGGGRGSGGGGSCCCCCCVPTAGGAAPRGAPGGPEEIGAGREEEEDADDDRDDEGVGDGDGDDVADVESAVVGRANLPTSPAGALAELPVPNVLDWSGCIVTGELEVAAAAEVKGDGSGEKLYRGGVGVDGKGEVGLDDDKNEDEDEEKEDEVEGDSEGEGDGAGVASDPVTLLGAAAALVAEVCGTNGMGWSGFCRMGCRAGMCSRASACFLRMCWSRAPWVP